MGTIISSSTSAKDGHGYVVCSKKETIRNSLGQLDITLKDFYRLITNYIEKERDIPLLLFT